MGCAAMNKAILCIGGSELQLPGLNWAKQAGLRVLLTDASPNPPGRQLADTFAQIPGGDITTQIDFAREQSRKYQIISAYCGSDFGLRSVAMINRSLGLPGLDLQAIETSLHKARANAVLKESGLPTPDGMFLKAGQTPVVLNYPVIVKPVEGSGSRGVSRVDCSDQLECALNEAYRVCPEILIERVVEGEHIDVSGFFAEGYFFPAGQLKRYFSELPHRYPVWGYQPPDLELAAQKNLYRLLELAARALKLDWGPVKADIILGPDGPVIIEVTPRFHGDVSTSFVCPLAYGVSPVSQWMQWLASGVFPPMDMFFRPAQKAGWAGIFPPHPGTVQSIHGVNQATTSLGIARVIMRHGPGWRIHRVGDNLAVMGFLFAVGDNSTQLYERLMAGLARISVQMSTEVVG
jgi:biotin carboxylase